LVQSERKAKALFTFKKALYGTLQVALLFRRLLSSMLQDWGNEYNLCVMNKIIKGKQCTIIRHVDDLKISNAEKEVVEDILKQLATNFERTLQSLQPEKKNWIMG